MPPDQPEAELEDSKPPPHDLADLIKLETPGVTSQSRTAELFRTSELHRDTIVAKLRSVSAHDLAKPLAECHTHESFAQCQGCGAVRHFWNRCDLSHCPICQPKLARHRVASLEWWTHTLTQPKHVVLTVRNTDTLSETYVRWFKSCISKLRRSRFASNWESGVYSLEVTNEGRGWHLHAHLLIDAKWIDAAHLARKWAAITGQDFAIVKVRDARSQDYLREVAKYAVKGSQLATWSGLDIAAFIIAFQATRTFAVFGSLYGKRTEWRAWLDQVAAGARRCTCGCDHWRIFTAPEWEWHRLTHEYAPRPPPPITPQTEFAGMHV